MRKVRLSVLLATTAIAVVAIGGLTACASLPLPDNPDQSLFVMVYDFRDANFNDGRQFAGATLTIRQPLTREVVTMNLPNRGTWAAIPLDPGAYRIEQVVLRFSRGDHSWTDTHRSVVPIFIPERAVVISRSMMVVNTWRFSDRYDLSYPQVLQWSEHARLATEGIRSDRMWAAWEGYTEVNFYTPSGLATTR